MLATETVAISIGDGHSGTSIVLPRGHQLVRHLEALIVPPTPTAHMTRPVMTTKRTEDAVAALASLSQSQTTPTLPALPRHLFQTSSPSSVGAFPSALPRPASPYLSDSSHSSSSSCHTNTNTGVRRRRTGTSAQCNGKKCQIDNCDKISVSRGLCRGHGGGRRCQHAGCSKGAQSRSDYCWSHGGGQRCEVPNCMRSRKTKRFCVAHLTWEHAPEGAPLPIGEMTPRVVEPAAPKMLMPRVEVLRPSLAKLPSLQQALQKHNQCIPVMAPSRTMSFANNYGPIMNHA